MPLGEGEAVAEGHAGTLQSQPGLEAHALMLTSTAPPLAPFAPGAPPAVPPMLLTLQP